MAYPVGNGTKEDYDKNWYVASGFGVYRNTYYHSGLDINLKTGGNTDLGEPIRAVLDGKIVYYHNNSHPTKYYGRHNVYEIMTSRGKRWIHQAHCDSIVTKVQEIKKGGIVANIGKSGTVYAHLHLSCFKVDPGTLPNGIDTIAKTKEQLDKWFEDPSWLFDYKEQIMSDPTSKELETLRKKNAELEKDLETQNEHVKNLQGQVNGLLEDNKNIEIDFKEEKKARIIDLQRIAAKLGCTDDVVEILKDIEKTLVAEQGLTKCITDKDEVTKKYSDLVIEYDKVIEILARLGGRDVASSKGVENAMNSYCKLQDKLPQTQLSDYSTIIKLLNYTILTKRIKKVKNG